MASQDPVTYLKTAGRSDEWYGSVEVEEIRAGDDHAGRYKSKRDPDRVVGERVWLGNHPDEPDFVDVFPAPGGGWRVYVYRMTAAGGTRKSFLLPRDQDRFRAEIRRCMEEGLQEMQRATSRS